MLRIYTLESVMNCILNILAILLQNLRYTFLAGGMRYLNTLEKSAMWLPVKTYVFDCTLRRQKNTNKKSHDPKFLNQITIRLFEH